MQALEWSKVMADKKQLKDEADFYSSRISETSRFVGFGLLAIFYAIKVDSSDSLAADDFLVTLLGVFGAASVLLDYLQYVFGYLMVRSAQRNPPDHSYGDGAAGRFFALKSWAFYIKQIAAILGSVIVIFLVLCT